MVKINYAWGMRDKSLTKSSFSVSANSKLTKINDEMMQELAQISANIGLLMKQSQEHVNAVAYQPPRQSMYEESYYEKDTCIVTDQMASFWTNFHRCIQDY